MSTLKVNKLENTNTSNGGISIDTSGHVSIDGQQLPSAGPLSNRNLIINGAMQVAQRGTSFTLAHDGTTQAYTLDRFYFASDNLDSWDGTVTQVSDAPPGFPNSLKVTTGTAESAVDADEHAYIQQRIEAQNLQHINNGTSDALPLKLSFWVKTSQAGTYGFAIYKDDNTARLITATYTTTTADWEYKTIDIPGDTSGGGIDNNTGIGIRLYWPFAAGSGWTSTDSTSWINYADAGLFYGHAQNATATTASATWQITGVQLEVGETATPFEHRSYGDELFKCQRYFQKLGGSSYKQIAGATQATTTTAKGVLELVTTMRSTPDAAPAGTGSFFFQSGDLTVSNNVVLTALWTAGSDGNAVWLDWEPGSGTFAANNRDYGRIFCNNNTTAQIHLSAEL